MSKLLLSASALALAGTAGTATAQDVTIRYAHMNSPSHFVNAAGERIAEGLRERTGGAVEVQLFPSGELGENSQVGEQIALGADMIGQVGPGVLANYVPDFSIIVYPFLFRDFDEAQAFLDGDLVAEMEARAEDSGIKVLCYFAFGIRDLYTIDTPVRSPADSAGLKVRVQPVTIYTEMVEQSFDAAPTPMPWPEVYSALAQGVIDAAEAPPAAILDQKHFEHARYLSKTNHILDISPIITSTTTWAKLSADQQTAVQEEADEACAFMSEQALQNYDAGIETLRAEGMEIIEDVDRQAFAAGAAGIAAEFPEWSPGLYERVQEQLGR